MYINVSNKRLSISSEELYSFGGGRDEEGIACAAGWMLDVSDV